ncbi:hypothetical protein C823_003315 [Eubacterium plexicaudatum ASF492]|uniref:FkbH domain-containing protein n=1 Tax=Eubacterium plexicaudatum ASF492 TaxID=1235802 RepID=N2AEF3_9FIRM|nr:hypothetical protein C823_003315 [Eubacterium plexicaudatum ASF492]
MYTFKQVKKAEKLRVQGAEYKLVVLGNCATQFLAASISGYAKLEGINLHVFDVDYNQIDVQLRDSDSETYQSKPDAVLIYLASHKLYEEFMRFEIEERVLFADEIMSRLETYWDLILCNCKARILQMNFTEINDKVLGNYSAKAQISFTYQIRKLNMLLQERMMQKSNVYPIDLLSVQIGLGNHVFYDPVLYYTAKMPIALNALPYVASAITDVLKALQGKLKKCVILDLDNTIWGGVIGDDGLAGIEIGELGRGFAFTNFQLWLRQLRERGIILAVCSKNEESTAKEPFEKHKEMILRLSDISIFVSNWEDKASNIKMIQKKLNIGMDSLVFIDDNPFERNLVRTMIPEVTVPELPEDPARYLIYLQELNLFETIVFSDEDKNRTGQYQAEFKRNELKQSFSSIDGYLKGLEMIGEAKAFQQLDYPRIAQLTQRSNQFNLRTIRYTEDDIQRMAEDDRYLTFSYTLQDKFGDHGLIAVVIMEKISKKEVFVNTWIMSCRVLKRGMEGFIVNKMVEEAGKAGFEIIRAQYIPTAKNLMVKDIYKDMGFEMTQEYEYQLCIKQYNRKNNFIKEKLCSE